MASGNRDAICLSAKVARLSLNEEGYTQEAYLLEFELTGLPKTTNGSHGHWRAKASLTKKWKKAVFAKAWPLKPKEPLKHALITLTRLSSVEPDYDNLVISFKPIIDGLRQAQVLSDDKRKNIGRPEYLWEQAKKGEGKIKVRVEAKATKENT